MKKIKSILLSPTPLLIAIGFQIIAVYYLLFLACIFMFGIAPSINGMDYGLEDVLTITQSNDFNTIASIIFSVFCIAFFAIWFYKSYGGNFKIDFKKNFHSYEILGILLLVPGAQFMSSIVVGIISMIFPQWLEDYMALIENAGLAGNVSLLMLIYSVCLAPVSEELIFRGVTYGIARKAFPFWIANTIQALLFGLFHLNPLQGCYTFILGLFMGYIFEKGGTIYHAILFHLLFNLWGTTASQWLVLSNETTQALIIIIGTCFGLAGGFYFFKKGNKLK